MTQTNSLLFQTGICKKTNISMAGSRRAWSEFRAIWTALFFLGIVVSATGAVFGYVKYFRDDNYASQFSALMTADADLDQVSTFAI
jgi:hypothetical protein